MRLSTSVRMTLADLFDRVIGWLLSEGDQIPTEQGKPSLFSEVTNADTPPGYREYMDQRRVIVLVPDGIDFIGVDNDEH